MTLAIPKNSSTQMENQATCVSLADTVALSESEVEIRPWIRNGESPLVDVEQPAVTRILSYGDASRQMISPATADWLLSAASTDPGKLHSSLEILVSDERNVISVGSDLGSALKDIEDVMKEALLEGYPPPSELAIDNARKIVEAMFRVLPLRYDIYPSDDGEVVIDGGGDGRRIFVYCYPSGDVLYIGWIDGERRHLRTSGYDGRAPEFLRRMLDQLGKYLAT